MPCRQQIDKLEQEHRAARHAAQFASLLLETGPPLMVQSCSYYTNDHTSPAARLHHCCTSRLALVAAHNKSAHQPTRRTAITEPEPMPTIPKPRPPSLCYPANSPRICHNRVAPFGNIQTKNEVSHPAHPATKPAHSHQPPNHLRPHRVKPPISNIQFPPLPTHLLPAHTMLQPPGPKNLPPSPSRLPPYLRLTPYYLKPWSAAPNES